MSRFLVLCMILADLFAVLVAGAKTDEHNIASFRISDAPSPTPSPSFNGKWNLAKVPTARKLGKHQNEVLESVAASPSSDSISSQAPSEAYILVQDNEVSQIHLEKKHHNIDKSIFGGGVILGGLATTFMVVVFCYIRATGRKTMESSVSSTSPL